MNLRPAIEVKKPGLLTTVQDLGRYGFQKLGMVVGGAMDPFSLMVGNLLVGNDERAAGLEITMIGPELTFMADSVICITGGDLQPYLNLEPIPMWKAVPVSKHSVLTFGRAVSGCRAYLTIRGGIEVPAVMGSRSTYLRAQLGGYLGRALMKGDILCTSAGCKTPKNAGIGRRLNPKYIPKYQNEITLRVIMGPQAHYFSDSAINTFLTSTFTVTSQADRMGLRLTGPLITSKGKTEMISDPIPMGAIQIPQSGEPIILLADRQTTGGYPKIGVVISADIPKVAQAKPGDTIRFSSITLDESHDLLKRQEAIIRSLRIATYNLRSANS
jgi:antagonist of KipI